MIRRSVLIVSIPTLVGCAAAVGPAPLDRLDHLVTAVERARIHNFSVAPGPTDDERDPYSWRWSRASADEATWCLSAIQPDGDDDEQTRLEAAIDGARRVGNDRPLDGFAETVLRDLRAFPGVLWDDTKRVYTSPTNLLLLGVTYGGSLALQQSRVDDSIEADLRDRTILSSDATETFGVLGNPVTHFALAGVWYALGQQLDDETTYTVGKRLFRALTLTGLSTLLGKAASSDRAPNGEWGAFPSGHTSSTFAFASVMHQTYGPLVGAPLYGVGVLVAMSRLEDEEHRLSGVIMGGVIGLVIGHTVAAEQPLELFGGEIQPFADPQRGSTGVAWVRAIPYD